MGKEPAEKNPKDLFDRVRDAIIPNADKIEEHNEEIDNFGNKPEPRPSESPRPEPREPPRGGLTRE